MDELFDKSTAIRTRATEEERAFLRGAAGGEKDVSNFIRRAIRRELEASGIEVPAHLFQERAAGNWTKGENRRGKENRPLTNIGAA